MRNPFKGLATSIRKLSIQAASASHAGYNPGGHHNHYGGGMSGGAKWYDGLSNSGKPKLINHYEMRQNARRSYHETLQSRIIIDRNADIVVDVGIRVMPTPDPDLLGISVDEAEAWSEEQNKRFHLYMGSKKCHVSETMTGYQMQRLYSIMQLRDNDIFTRLYYFDDESLPSPLQFDFVDPDQFRWDAYTYTNGFNDSHNDGIERDPFGREISYKVWLKSKENPHQYVPQIIPAVGDSGRRHMIHGFSTSYPGQGRGFSGIGHALQELENLTDFSASTIKKAINQASITMFVKPSKDEDAVDPLAGITNLGAGPASSSLGNNPTPSADAQNVTPESLRGVEYSALPEATMRAPGSVGIFNLTKGSDLIPFANSAPGDSYDKFVDAFFTSLAASCSMPVEVALMRFSSNYSASRGALILFWQVAMIKRAEIGSDWIRPIYESWLSEEIAAGRVVAIGWSDPRMREAWLSFELNASPVPNIDDFKSAKANKINLSINAMDFDTVARNTNNMNGKVVRAKLKRQVEDVVQMPWEIDDNGESS